MKVHAAWFNVIYGPYHWSSMTTEAGHHMRYVYVCTLSPKRPQSISGDRDNTQTSVMAIRWRSITCVMFGIYGSVKENPCSVDSDFS